MPEYGGLGGTPAWGGNPAAEVGGRGPEWNGEGCDAGGMAAGYCDGAELGGGTPEKAEGWEVGRGALG